MLKFNYTLWVLPSGIESCNFLRRFLRRFCVDFASIFDFCVDFASIFDPKSWSQTKKLELVLFKLKFREPLYLLGFSENITNHLVGCPVGLEPSTFRTTI